MRRIVRNEFSLREIEVKRRYPEEGLVSVWCQFEELQSWPTTATNTLRQSDCHNPLEAEKAVCVCVVVVRYLKKHGHIFDSCSHFH